MNGESPLNPVSSLLLRGAASLLAGWRGRSRSLLILIYHRVLAAPDAMMPDELYVARFGSQMDLLARNFRVLPLREAVARLGRGDLPARSVCITFDDGYANNCELAMPILRARQLPATVFVASGYLNGGAMFNDVVHESLRIAPAQIDLRALGLGQHEPRDMESRRVIAGQLIGELKYLSLRERTRVAGELARICGLQQLPNQMMSDTQVRELHASGIEIGAHTAMHPILTSVSEAEARHEIASNKLYLEQLLGEPVRSFAYPNGTPKRDYDRRHVELVRAAGFDIALSTAWGVAHANSDMLQLPRIAPWDRRLSRYAMRMAYAYSQRKPDLA
jgi:peptidoglycan/xylan/chitin deacetylase (PgdA/CDA1 family)